jgi:hypothetical protein
MKKINSTKKTILISALIALIAVLIGWGYQSSKNIIPDSPDTLTVSQGTQAHFETLFIGLNSVDNNSAWLSIHKDGEEGSTTKRVIAGDIVAIYNYIIEIKSVNKGFSFSTKLGSGHGNVKFIVRKQ